MLGIDRSELKGTFGSQPKAACTCTDIPSDKGEPKEIPRAGVVALFGAPCGGAVR